MQDAPEGGKGEVRMHMLLLSEESAHVRSVARSWAAGEVPLEDYRMIRGLTLDGLLGDEAAGGEAERARAAAAANAKSETSEDFDVTAVGASTTDDAETTGPNPGIDPQAAAQRTPASRYLLIGAVLLVVIGVGFVLATG